MKFSLSTGTLYIYPLRTVFRWARTTGFDGVELVVNPEAIVRGGQAVRRLAEAEGVEIFSVHPTVAPLPRWRERKGGMGATIRLAQEAGAGVVVMHTPRIERLDEGAGLVYREKVEVWQGWLAGSGLRLAVENRTVRSEADRRYALTSVERLRAFADRHDLGLVLDTSHAGASGDDLRRIRRTFDGRLVNVHFSDVGGRVPSALPAQVRTALGQHRFPGAGRLPLADLLVALADDGYVGPVTLEINPLTARIWWPPAIRRRLAQALAWMRRAARHTSPVAA